MGRKRAIRARGQRGDSGPHRLGLRRFGSNPRRRARAAARRITRFSERVLNLARAHARRAAHRSRGRAESSTLHALAPARALSWHQVGARAPPRRRRRRRLPLPRPLAARDRGARPARTPDGVRRARGVAPSWSDASWLCVSDFGAFGDDADVPARETAWAQVGPWGAFALVSAFRLETDTWNALRFAAASRPEFRVGWISSIPKHHKRAVRPSPHRRLWNRRRARRSSPRTRRRDASFRVAFKRRYGTGRRAHTRGTRAFRAFLHKSRRLVRAVEPRSIPNLDLVQPEFVARGVRAPDRALFFTGEPKAEVS